MELGRGHASDHVSDGISTQRILEEAREPGVPVGDMRSRLARRQLGDDLPEAGQSGVDGDALFGALTLSAGVLRRVRSAITGDHAATFPATDLQSFTARQIDKMQLAIHRHPAVGAAHGLHGHRESFVRLRGG